MGMVEKRGRQTAGLAAAETKRGGQKHSPHGAGRTLPKPAVLRENHDVSSIRFHEVRHALAPRPDSRRFWLSSAINPKHGLRGLATRGAKRRIRHEISRLAQTEPSKGLVWFNYSA